VEERAGKNTSSLESGKVFNNPEPNIQMKETVKSCQRSMLIALVIQNALRWAPRDLCLENAMENDSF